MLSLTLVSRSEVKEAKDGRKYFVAQLSPGFGQLNISRVMWQQFKKDSKTGLPTLDKYWERGTPEQADALIASQSPILGRKVTHTVEKYSIGTGETAREVNKYSTVVFADENEETVFANSNHPIVDKESGEVRNKKAILASNTKVSVAAEAIAAK